MPIDFSKIKIEDSIERVKVKATTLSPLHIGGHQQTLDKFEYIVKGNQVFVFESGILYDEEGNDNKPVSDAVLRGWTNGTDSSSLTRVYNDWSSRKRTLDLNQYAQYSIEQNGSLQGDNQYRPFIRNANFRAYVPGSSIKGALRNAWLYYYLAKNYEALKEVAAELKTTIGQSHRSKNAMIGKLNDSISENIFRRGFGQSNNSIQDELFRAILVSDSNLLDDTDIAAERVEVLCHNNPSIFDGKGNAILYKKPKLTIVEECVQENTTFEFELRINHTLLRLYQDKENAPTSCQDILLKTDQFFNEVWNWDLDFFDKPDATDTLTLQSGDVIAPRVADFYAQQKPSETEYMLRVGAGSGLHSVTPDLLLQPKSAKSPDDEDLFKNGDNSLETDIGYYAFWEMQEKATIFPKSRKIIWRQAQQPYIYPTGWLKLQVG